MEFGEDLDLDLDMLSENQDLNLDIDENKEGEQPSEKKENITETISEKETSESVADKGGEETSDATSSPDNADNNISAMYSSLATHFHESGVLPSLNIEEAEIKSVDDFAKAIQEEINNGVDEATRQYREAITKGEPEDFYIEYVKQKEQLSRITDDTLESSDPQMGQLRLNIIAQDFINRGFSREESLTFAKRSQDLGEDVNDSKKAIERIREYNETSYKTKVAEQEAEQQKAVDDLNKFIDTTDEIIKGVKLTQATKDTLKKQLTVASEKSKDGKPLTAFGKAVEEDPVKTKIITEYLFMLTKGYTDFSKITDLIGSKTTKEIDDIIRNTGGDFLKTGKIDFNIKDKNQSFSFEDGMTLDV